MNTTEKGDRLRDDVYALLKAAGKSAVKKEFNLGGKKVDVYYEEPPTIPGPPIRIAVEAKNYEVPIGRTTYGNIFTDYSAVKHKFDFLLIVTKRGTTSSVLESISTVDWIAHEEYRDFCNRLLDFSRYLEGLRALFARDGLDSYYESARDTEGCDIEHIIDEWIDGDSHRPKAILAGYGMGKTSLSRRLAHKYADLCLRGKTSRVPVYIKLGDIVAEQTLSGLICKHFVEESVVNGFNYNLFRSFNRRGRFVFILDGFDEMKHAMTFSAFEYNIGQIRELVEESSRVVLLGRPSAFMSDEERSVFLHGVENMGATRIENASIPDFEEIKVAFFNISQLARFVKRYLRHAAAARERLRGLPFTDDELERHAERILAPRYQELISRPVHARMMVQIALSTDEPLDGFTPYVLYDRFFKLNLQRESEKPARRGPVDENRLPFVRAVAWRSWVSGESGAISQRTLRAALRDVGIPQTDEAQLRELIIGSVLETKAPDRHYFPHRSFAEFLSAQYLLEANISRSLLADLSNSVNVELLAFIEGSGRAPLFSQAVLDALSSYVGPMKMQVLEFLAKTAKLPTSDGLKGASEMSGPGPVLAYVMALENFELERIERDLYDLFSRMTATADKLAVVIGVCRRMRLWKDEGALEKVGAALTSSLHMEAFEVMERRAESHHRTAASSDSLIWTKVMVGSIEPHVEHDELRSLKLDLGGLELQALAAVNDWIHLEEAVDYHQLVSIQRPEWMKALWHSDRSAAGKEVEDRRRQELGIVAKFWRGKPKINDFVPVASRAPLEKGASRASTLTLTSETPTRASSLRS